MKLRGQTTLADALAEWGSYEQHVRAVDARAAPHFEPGTFAAIDHALMTRSALIARMLAEIPVVVFTVDVEPADYARLVYADGNTPQSWVARVLPKQLFVDQDRFWQTVSADAPLAGLPLLVTSDIKFAQVVVVDGCYRMAAWRQRLLRGRTEPVTTNLVVTRNEFRLNP